MLFLIAAVICGALISISFKLFRKLGIDSLQGIFVNYLTAMTVSVLISGGTDIAGIFRTAFTSSWLPLAIAEGFFFMGGIVVMSLSTQNSGLAVSNIAARASMIIPVLASHIAFGQEKPEWLLIAAVIAAMIIIFADTGARRGENGKMAGVLLPVGVFFFYGTCDFLLKVLKTRIGDSPEGYATLFIFSTAAVFCLIACILRGGSGKHPFDWKAIPGGIFLGTVNSGCTALMMKGLGAMDASVFFPAYNVGVVLLTLLTGTVFFKEKLSAVQIAGIFLALAAIVMLLR